MKNVKKVMDGLQLNSPENKGYTMVLVCVVDTLLKTNGIAFLPEKPYNVAASKNASEASNKLTEAAETNAAARLTLQEVQKGEGWLMDDDSVKYGSRLKTLIVRAPILMPRLAWIY